MRSAHALAAPAGFRSEEGQAGGVPESLEEKRARLRALRQIQFGAETFEGFVYRMQPMYCPVPNHLRPLYELIERSRHEQIRALVSFPPRHGKRLKSDTKILTPRGWRTHGDLRVGDEVYAPDGTMTRVVYVSPDGPIDLRVTFDDGSVIDAHSDHLWHVWNRRSNRYEVMDTKAMLTAGVMHEECGKRRAGFSVAYTQPLDGPDVTLSHEPWMMGYWLGNGTTGLSKITIGPDDAAHVTAEMARRGHGARLTWTHSATRCVVHDVPTCPAMTTKRIPPEFLVASLEQRRALMAGLVDSDGSVEPRTGRVRYVTTLPDLAEDVMQLVATLGYRPSLTVQAPHTGRAQGRDVVGKLDVYTVQWTPHDGVPPGTLPRKRFTKVGVRRRRSIVSIEALKIPGVGQCIQVDHPDHLYLVGDRLVPTHNSQTLIYALAWRCLYDPAVQNVYATYGKDLAEEHGRAVRSIAQVAGVQVGRVSFEEGRASGSAKVLDWKTPMGGGLKSTSVGGSITGRPCHGLMVLDDTLKGHEAAESLTERNRVWSWLRSDILSRLEGGGSVILCGTRWHEDDPIGRMLNGGPDWPPGLGEDYVHINLPAIGDEFGNPVDEREHPKVARPLWNSINARYPTNDNAAMEWYRICRARGEYEWWALYQGIPRSRGQKLFAEEPALTWMPIQFKGRRAMLMLDPAATAKTSSDYSALGCFTMKGYGDATIWGHDKWGERVEVVNPNPSVMEVVEIWKDRVPVPAAVEEAYRWQQRYGGLHCGVEVDGTGANLPDWIRKLCPKLVIAEIKTGGRDKFTRAQLAAKMWNTGRILVPRADEQGRILDEHGEPYRSSDGGYVTWQCPPREYVRVMKAFTGMGDPEDDVVDITSHAANRLWRPWNESRQGTVRAPAY